MTSRSHPQSPAIAVAPVALSDEAAGHQMFVAARRSRTREQRGVSVLVRLRYGEERPVVGSFPLFFESPSVKFRKLTTCGIIEHYQILGRIDAGDHHVMKNLAVAHRVKCNNQRTSLSKMLIEIVPSTRDGKAPVAVLFQVALHRRRIDPMRFRRMQFTKDRSCIGVRPIVAAYLPVPILHDHRDARSTAALA